MFFLEFSHKIPAPCRSFPRRFWRPALFRAGGTAPALWKSSLAQFRRHIRTRSLTLLDPEAALRTPEALFSLTTGSGSPRMLPYSGEQYALHIERLMQLEKQYERLHVRFRSDAAENTLLYVKEDAGVIMAKIDARM